MVSAKLAMHILLVGVKYKPTLKSAYKLFFMNWYKILVFLCVLLSYVNVYSQHKNVDLVVESSNNTFYFISNDFHISNQNPNSYRLPKLTTLAIYELYTNDNKLFFLNYSLGKIPDSIFSIVKKARFLNENDFYNFTNDDIVEILIGIDSNNNYIVIPNINNNHSFLDDTIFIYKHNQIIENRIQLENIEYKNINYSIGEDSMLLNTFYSFNIYIDSLSFLKSTVTSLNNCVYKGKFVLEDSVYSIIINPISTGLDFKYSSLINYKIEKTNDIKIFKNVNVDPGKRIKKSIKIDNYTFRLDSVDLFGKSAIINIVKNREKYSEFDFLKQLRGKRIDNGENAYILGSKRFKILDFWGSWCLPCIAQHKTMMKNYSYFLSKNILIKGIVIDQNDFSAAKKYLKSSNLIWNNYLVKSQDYIDFFNITSYPTYIFLSKSNEIIYRTYNYQLLLNFIQKKFQ